MYLYEKKSLILCVKFHLDAIDACGYNISRGATGKRLASDHGYENNRVRATGAVIFFSYSEKQRPAWQPRTPKVPLRLYSSASLLSEVRLTACRLVAAPTTYYILTVTPPFVNYRLFTRKGRGTPHTYNL